MEEFRIIAKTMMGLEPVLADELVWIGAKDVRTGNSMVEYMGDKETLYRSNLCLRTALRVLKPIKSFTALDADELYAEVRDVDWREWMTADDTFAVDSVVYSDEFRHSKFVAYRVKDAIADSFMDREGRRPSVRLTDPDLRIHIHVSGTESTLSLDSSGESLHKRGYRVEDGKAPLNEVLAAGIVLTTGWTGECDFIDPMCGSGTIAIEAALIALGISPGVYRKGFAFEKWRDFDAELLRRVYDDDSQEKEFHHKIYAYDTDKEALAATLLNAKSAGVLRHITVRQQNFADFKRPDSRSVIVMNPPYGKRLRTPDLAELYGMIGHTLKNEFQGYDAWVLGYRYEGFNAMRLHASSTLRVMNGELECELRKYRMVAGKYSITAARSKRMESARMAWEITGEWDGGYRRQPERMLGESEERFAERLERFRKAEKEGRMPKYQERYLRRQEAMERKLWPRETGERPMTDRERRQEERKKYFGTPRDFDTIKRGDDSEEDT